MPASGATISYLESSFLTAHGRPLVNGNEDPGYEGGGASGRGSIPAPSILIISFFRLRKN